MLQYGIEIEAIGVRPSEAYRSFMQLLPNYNWLYMDNRPTYWNVGTDGSVDVEVRSRIMQNDWTEVFDVLTALKLMKATTNKKCGLHIHVSFIDGRQVDASRLKRIFWERYGQIAWGPRGRTYASFRNSTTSKYHAIRQVGYGHVEFRMFNGTLNAHGVNAAFKIVRDSMLAYN